MNKIKSIMQTESLIKYLLSCGIIAVILVVLELTVFNVRHYQTMGNQPFTPEYSLHGFEETIYEGEGESAVVYVATGEMTPFIEMNNLDTKVTNIHADYTFPLSGVTAVEEMDFHIEARDEGNELYYPMPQQNFLHNVAQTHFSYIETYGKADSIRIYLDSLKKGDVIRIEIMELNARSPLMIGKKRVVFLFILLMILFILRPASFLWKEKVSGKNRIVKMAVAALLVLEIICSFLIVNMNSYFKDYSDETGRNLGEKQYQLLSRSMSEGRFDLLVDPCEELLGMEDPYDYPNRMEKCGNLAMYDTAFFEGRYYVYFGVLPVVTYYLPYYLITGCDLPNYVVVFINAVLIILSLCFILKDIAVKWFENVPLPVFLMLCFMISFGCGVLFLLMTPNVYEVAISSGLALMLLGIFCWLKSVSKDTINPVLIALGSLFMALTVSARPQFILASVLCILIFWKAAIKDRILFSKKSLVATVSFIVPYVFVAVLVMYYNYARFGSVLDFGSRYNLTIDNLPYRDFRENWFLYGIVGWLFYPCNVNNIFPYFHLVDYNSTAQSYGVCEKLFGGLIYNNIYLLPVLFFWKFKLFIKNKSLYLATILMPLIGFVVMVVDFGLAAVVNRYCGDVAVYFMIPAFIIICALFSKAANQVNVNSDNSITLKVCEGFDIYKILKVLLYVIFIWTVVRMFLMLFDGTGSPIDNMTLLFYKVRALVEFWK